MPQSFVPQSVSALPCLALPCLALPCLAWAQQQAIAHTTPIPSDNARQFDGGSNGEGEPGRFVVTVSVADNSEDSALNADDVIEAVVRPQQHPELHALLGSPQSTRRTFDYMPVLDGAEDEYIALIGTTRHYVNLTYWDEAGLDETLRRLREDPRFAYVGRQHPPGFSAAPNDPYFANPQPWTPDFEQYQYASQPGWLNLPAAWDRIKGWATVGIMDQLLPVVSDSSPSAMRTYHLDHPDLNQVSYNLSWNFTWQHGYYYGGRDLRYVPQAPANGDSSAHSAHVMGLVAATANNDAGIVGACWHCSVAFAQLTPAFDLPGNDVSSPPYLALGWLSYWGVQVVNFSGFDGDIPPCALGPFANPHCHAISIAEAHQISYVASAGNNLNVLTDSGTSTNVNFPAREPNVIGVSGLDIRHNRWDEHYQGAGNPGDWLLPSLGDLAAGVHRGCPDARGIYFPLYPPHECGSNISPAGNQQVDFAAPARRVLSTVPPGSVYVPAAQDLCNDYNFGTATDGYALCSGTSMSAPLVSGVVALVRSVNPLLSAAEVYGVMKATASGGMVYSLQRGWGVPDAGQAVSRAMGRVAGQVVNNRLTPMFALRNAEFKDRLYTTRPQVAIGALTRLYLAEPSRLDHCHPTPGAAGAACPDVVARPYSPASQSEGYATVKEYQGYPSFKPLKKPVSAFWVFTSEQPMWEGIEMRPLYRLSFAEACDWRDHIYTTDWTFVGILAGTDWCWGQLGNQPFQYDAIEGYILASCPPGYRCGEQGTEVRLEPLYRRYCVNDESNALLTGSQLAMPQFSVQCANDTYGGGSGLLGYVFPNEDGDNDGLIDGMEAMYGMNPAGNDSDCDGLLDGFEFPITSVQSLANDPRIGPCG